MRGRDEQSDGLFSYVRLEKRIPEMLCREEYLRKPKYLPHARRACTMT
jgi:hypothetical protein